MSFMSRKKFLERFVFAVAEDFKGADGKPASFAGGHPKQWGDEDAVIDIPEVPTTKPYEYITLQLAVTDDEKLLAVSRGRTIFIYDIETKQLKSELKGHEANVHDLSFQPRHCQAGHDRHMARRTSDSTPHSPDTYTLISAASHASGADSAIVIWELLPTGHLLPNGLDEGPDVSSLTIRAVDSILHPLSDDHDFTSSDIESVTQTLWPAFHSALSSSLAAHALRKHQTVLSGASLPVFTPPTARFHPTAQQSLYLTHNETTQHGSRPPADLPHVHLYSPSSSSPSTPLTTLSGHTDMITWAGYSPFTGRYLATVAWDGSMSVYDLQDPSPETGHSFTSGKIGEKGGQAWCAAFSPDETHVAVSGGNGLVLQVWEVGTGRNVAQFPPPPPAGPASGEEDGKEGVKLQNWVRQMSWSSPSFQSNASLSATEGPTLFFAAREKAYAWNPFNQEHGRDNSPPDDAVAAAAAGPRCIYNLDIPERIMRTFASISLVSHFQVPLPRSVSSNLTAATAIVLETPKEEDMFDDDTRDKDMEKDNEGQEQEAEEEEEEILTLLFGDGTLALWAPLRNIQWRFMRPPGRVYELMNGGVSVLTKGRSGGPSLVSLDGDARLRFWTL